MIKKIALLDIFVANTFIVESTGLGSLSSVLQEHGYETFLAAYTADKIDYDSIFSFKPDVIGMPVNYESIDTVKEVCMMIKEKLTNVIFFTGGYLATNNVEEIMNEITDFEVVIRGEGEETLIEWIDARFNNMPYDNIAGISHWKDHQIIHNEDRALIDDLDKLPFPDRSVMVQHSIPLVQVEGARGCPCRCSFCSVHCFWTYNHSNNKGDWRPKSPKRVVDEIEYLAKNYDINRFRFLDCSVENPYMNINRMYEVTNEIISKNLNITYFVNFRSNVHKILSDDLIKKMIKSGLTSVFIGVESFDEDDLRLFSKTSIVEDSNKTIETLQKYPLYVNIGMINFQPYSTIRSLRKNAVALQKYNFASRLLFMRELTVFKGTPIYEIIKEDGLLYGAYKDTTNYRFKDHDVEIVHNFLFGIKNNEKLFSKLEMYSTGYVHLYNHLKNFYTKVSDEPAIKIIEEYGKRIDDSFSEFGDAFTKFVLSVLDLVEKNWDIEKANQFYNRYLGNQFLSNVVSSLEKSNVILQKKLIKLKPENTIHFRGMYHDI